MHRRFSLSNNFFHKLSASGRLTPWSISVQHAVSVTRTLNRVDDAWETCPMRVQMTSSASITHKRNNLGSWGIDLIPPDGKDLAASLLPPVAFPGWGMHGCASKQYNYFRILQHIYDSHASAKRRQKGLRVSSFALLFVVFKWHHGSEGVGK